MIALAYEKVNANGVLLPQQNPETYWRSICRRSASKMLGIRPGMPALFSLFDDKYPRHFEFMISLEEQYEQLVKLYFPFL